MIDRDMRRFEWRFLKTRSTALLREIFEIGREMLGYKDVHRSSNEQSKNEQLGK